MPRRPIDPDRLNQTAIDELKPPIGKGGALVWRYTVFVPVRESKIGENEQPIATSEDLDVLHELLCNHFHGLSILPSIMGYGLRDADDSDSLEINTNTPFVIYARPISAADKYFEQLQEELQDALDQGLVLIERQEAFLTGTYQVATS